MNTARKAAILAFYTFLFAILLAACGPQSIQETANTETKPAPTATREPTREATATATLAPTEVATLEPSPTPTKELIWNPTPISTSIPVEVLKLNENPIRQATFHINSLAYKVPEMYDVEIDDYTYAHHGMLPLKMDLYYPPGTPEDVQLPAVIMGMGIRSSREPLRNSHYFTSWGRLIAAAGMVAVVYDAEQPDTDLQLLLDTLRANAAQLRVDPQKLGLISFSSNTATVMSVLMQEKVEGLRFAIYYYGLSMTPDKAFWDVLKGYCNSGFCMYADLAPVSYVDPEVPLLVVEVGQEFIIQGNEAMDHFIEYVRSEGGTVTLIEYEDGVHGFDTEQHTPESAEIIKQTVAFMLASFRLEQLPPRQTIFSSSLIFRIKKTLNAVFLILV